MNFIENNSSNPLLAYYPELDGTPLEKISDSQLEYTPMDAALKGANNGVAELDSAGKVPSSQLPSYVDDVLEVDTFDDLPITGESGKIYVTLDDNKTYRWGGTEYVEISPSIALGETSATAYRGDRGKAAYDHSQIVAGNPHGTTASDVGAADADHNHAFLKNNGVLYNSANTDPLLDGVAITGSGGELHGIPTLPVDRGGTAANNAADALINLGVTMGTDALTPGSSALTTGAVYFQYE